MSGQKPSSADAPGPLYRQSSFTLIELVAAIIVLGLLAAVIVPKFFKIFEDAQQTAYRCALGEAEDRLYLAYGLYITETGQQPDSLDDLANATLLGGSNLTAIHIGDYDVAYSLENDTVTLILNSPGKTDALATDTTPWPQ